MRPQTFIVNQTLIIIHEHYALFMWNHQRWIIGRTHRRRERDIARWGEREREKRWRARVRCWFLSKTVIFGFDHRPKSTRYFKISLLVIFTQSYFETLANSEIACFGVFLLSNGFSGAHDFYSNNSDVFHNYFVTNSLIFYQYKISNFTAIIYLQFLGG